MTIVKTAAIASWNGNSGTPPPPLLVDVELEAVVETFGVEVVEDIVAVVDTFGEVVEVVIEVGVVLVVAVEVDDEEVVAEL
jgi:hypothetical protein